MDQKSMWLTTVIHVMEMIKDHNETDLVNRSIRSKLKLQCIKLSVEVMEL